jgi:hypothetical protein
MEINPAKTGLGFQKCDPVVCERLRYLVRVMALSGKIEAGHQTRVLVEARAFGQASERTFDRANA